MLIRFAAIALFGVIMLCSCAQLRHAAFLPLPVKEGRERSDIGDPTNPEIVYYLDRLSDRTFTRTYGDDENPKTWYTAAEELGRIGKPAIPYLMQRIDSRDPYEAMLALYALLLASQDPLVTSQTNGEYIDLQSVLTESANAENREIARRWWSRYQHLWD